MVPPCFVRGNPLSLLNLTKSIGKRSALASTGILRNEAKFSTKSAVLFVKASSVMSGKELPKSTCFATNFFRGVIHPDQVFPYPEVLSPEQKETLEALVDPVAKFMQEGNDPVKNDADMLIAPATMQGLVEMGAFGLQIPSDLSGLGLSNTQYARVMEIIGTYDLGVSVCLGAHQSIGLKGILLFGNPEQKKKYLPDLATGKTFAAFALTEPTSGSDAASIRTHAEPSPDGKSWILNGNKLWISNGGFAEIFTVFAQTPVKDPKTGETKTKMSAFIVERKFGGVTNSPKEKKMGIKGSNTTEVYFDNTPVPNENVLLKPGEGFKVAMGILNNGRFGLGAAMSGAMRGAIQKATDFAVNRTQFKQKIMNFGVIQEKLATMAMRHYATESTAYIVAGSMDKKFPDYHVKAAIGKVFASESAWYVVDEAIQIMGGMGFMKETGLERVIRDLRIFRIFEGTNDILRLLVATTGCGHVGAYLAAGQQASSVSAKVALTKLVHANLAKEAQILGETIDEFAKSVEKIVAKYGKGLTQEQFVLTRISDCAIDIMTMAAVLSRATTALNKKFPSAQVQELLAKAWVFDSSQRVRFNLGKTKGDALIFYGHLKEISKAICQEGGVCYPPAVGC